MTSSRLTHSHHSDPASLRRDGAVSDDHSWDAFRTAVIEELDAYFDGLKDAVTQSPGFPVLRSRVRDQVTGGKLLRPRLTHLAWRAFAGHTEPIMRARHAISRIRTVFAWRPRSSCCTRHFWSTMT